MEMEMKMKMKMKMKPPLSLFLFFFFFFITFHVTSGDVNTIREKCRHCAKDDAKLNFCITHLQKAHHADMSGPRHLGQLSISLVESHATATMDYIKQLQGQPCLALYEQAKSSAGRAVGHYHNKNYQEANKDFSAVIHVGATCEDGFKHKKVASPLTQKNDEMSKLSSLAMCFINDPNKGD